FFQAEDGIRDATVTGVQTCALPISLPDFTCGAIATTVSNITGTCPESRSGCAAVLPLYGTCSMSMPAMALNSSAERCGAPPLPEIGRASCRERVEVGVGRVALERM